MAKAKASRLKTRLVKVKGRKAKTWGKGHSSDSNPSITKYRDMASKNRHVINEGAKKTVKFQLSTEKLQNRNQNLLESLTLEDKNLAQDGEDEFSLPESAETQFTNFTNCSNPTFNKVHRLWKSGSELQNDVLSVLAAVTEVIKSSNGEENELEYFAVLVSSLTKPDQPLQSLAATVYLLSLVIKKVSYAVLCSRFSQISQCFYQLLTGYSPENQEANALLRYTLDCFGVLLKAQHISAWESSSMKQICDSILFFTIDERPRIRKSAQKAISDLLEGQEKVVQPHPVAKICSNFCTDTIERCGGTGKNVNSTLYAVQLLQKCMHNFGNHVIFKVTCESLLKLMTLCDQSVAQAVLRCFYNTFTNQPDDSAMNSELNGQLIMALYDFEPPLDDHKARLEWYKVMVAAHLTLLNKNKQMCASVLPKILENLLFFMPQIENKQIVGEISLLIKQILVDCLQNLIENDQIDENLCQKIGSALANVLTIKYYNIWPQCFDILSTYFSIFGQNLTYIEKFNVKSLLQSMGELRESENFAQITCLEKCIGSAIRYLGPEIVLAAIPVNVNPQKQLLSTDFPNSWLLPLLRNHVSKSKLSHFVQVFLPMAVNLTSRLEKIDKIDPKHELKNIERTVFGVVQKQLWDLLPAYCNKPTDLAESFKNIAKILGSILVEHPLLRLTVLSALRTLILKSIADDDESAKTELAKYAQNFLPILFNLYVSDKTNPEDHVGYDERGVRLATLETIRVYLNLTPKDLLVQYLNVALKKLQDLENDQSRDQSWVQKKQQHFVMDVLIALVKHLNSESISLLFSNVKNYCADEKSCDKALQKKSYRILEEILSSENEETKKFMKNEQNTIIDLLTHNVQNAVSATKASRLRCLNQLVENHVTEVDLPLITSLLPDAVLCLKEINIKTRKSAAIFLVTISNAIISKEKDAQKWSKIIWDRLSPFFDESESRDVSCALIAARIFIFEFKNDCSSEILSLLLSKVIFLLADERRPVVQSCLEFLKTFVTCLSQITVGQYLDLFVPALYKQNSDCQHHFRFLTRKILAKIMRKFSYEILKKYAPDQNFQKQLNNIRKVLQKYEMRKKMGKSVSENDERDEDMLSGVTGLSRPETIADLLRDSDDEDDQEMDENEPNFDSKSRKSRHSVKTPVFLQEDFENDEGILDFLDKKAPSMISTVSKNRKNSLKKNVFETDDQGRLIIKADNDKNSTKMEENVEFIELGKRKIDKTQIDNVSTLKKRKKHDILNHDDEDSDIDEALANYKPGGTGIHRQLGASRDQGGSSRDQGGSSRDNGSKKFKAKKGKGDVFVKDGMQPYAYVPFDFKQLNKRKRAKFSGKYKNLVEGARKGATKGSKGKNRTGK